MRITEEDIRAYEKNRSNEAVLEEAYKYYDSKMVAENLSLRGLGKFFKKVIISPGWTGTYEEDEKGLALTSVMKGKEVYQRGMITEGYMAIRNLTGSYDVHYIWREN